MTQKIAIILRGVPGSGKSSFVNLLKATSSDIAIHAIDDLHIDHNGNFLWDEENQSRLYTLNFANFVKSCSKSISIVVCDAINIQIKDFEKYVDIAKEFDYQVYIVTPDQPTPSESTKRNKHHTSSIQARDMYKKWEHWPSDAMLKELVHESI
tara:strand:+ start:30 stop:488 length:459 start_codon:yes stop_codon:yes gene_type:complete